MVVWVAVDVDTQAVVAGSRAAATARYLREALPDEYRDGAIVCTDRLEAYRTVVPEERRASGEKGTGRSAHGERFWRTVRQRCGRFVRESRSFSTGYRNHDGALWEFIRVCNTSLPQGYYPLAEWRGWTPSGSRSSTA